MNIIWKRPDGFHNATPDDYVVVSIGNRYNIWLHKKDDTEFPLRVSGGWEEETSTKKLNNLVNLLNKDNDQWVKHLIHLFHHSMAESPQAFYDEMIKWIQDIKAFIKGDQWEKAIMIQTFEAVNKKLTEVHEEFLNQTKE